MKNLYLILTTAMMFFVVGAYAQPEAGMPSEPGKCYAKCLIPDQYETITEEVLVKEASSKAAVVPASYETVTEEKLAKEAGDRLSIVPAKFESVSETLLSKEASTQLSIVPAKFEPVSETVLVKEGTPGLRAVAAKFEAVTEEVLVKEAYTVLKVVPARFETVTEEKLVQEASSRIRVIPERYETVTEELLVKPAYTVLKTVPAKYETVTEEVLVKEAYSVLKTIPAKYETVTEQVLVKQAGTRIERQPAKFATETETIEVAPASSKWVKRKADRNCLSANPEDCLVWCLVETPAQYRTVTKTVRVGCDAGWTDTGEDCTREIPVEAIYDTRSYQKLVSPATTTSETIPAKYETRSYQKLVSPATTTEETIPAQYETRSYEKLVSPPTTEVEEIPARYETVSYQRLVSPATTEVVEVPAEYRTRTYQRLADAATTVSVPCGSTTILRGINFRSGSAELLSTSNTEIDRVARLMRDQPGVSATLVGHTDSQGDDASNQDLSNRRAKAVYDALVDRGISAGRLSYEGRGETQPIASNATANGRLQNRRTEFITSGQNAEVDCNEYGSRTYQTLAADATVTSTEVPEQFITRSYEKLVADASTTREEIPAQYINRTYETLASPASVNVTNIPAQYKTISKRQLVKKGGFTEWREVVCDSDITSDLIRRVQNALISRGYDVGSSGADNSMGPGTKAALVKFQRDNGLPVGQVDVETLKALGVK